jgi:hypothetical protein
MPPLAYLHCCTDELLHRTEATSLHWKISVLGKSRYSAMACCGEIEGYTEFEMFEKTVLVISKEY